ncbi:radical SAM family heme chaperone HemW [Altererythrobacter sp.]|uniref:radical SAM family heme chaperone HemW n=1 Tax=Altererythrobacter sp. TaxID=1872480 RepID=UPI001B04D86C|nr:radical SAM family heme chaperone HemW [Altererythrobacter sp.]MBO6641389.1 coproporphyrinogen III oxidase [Altererythrobacter sp.]MBO6707913.1 coproporphyrinogen III oxidase [Altererythrobacter sp.]MBO6945956.1 coproporphyrinogen III oxidase [Altererythrobacter sp.]
MARALYIHWPFCAKKCPYCDFNSHVRERVDMAAWRDALLADMRHEAKIAGGETLHSIFFGGGTPSLMPPKLVEALLQEAEALWGFDANIEITLEANPSSVEAANFSELAQAGVNRVSLGVQSLEDDTLQFLGRLHGADEALQAVETAQQNFDRVSIDLIYAHPGQSAAQWTAELNRALALGTDHMSLYQLTIEPNTRFATDVRRGAFTPLDDDPAGDLYALTQEIMNAAGLPAYEISNHAKPGQESRHNLTYWRYQDYCGIGPGAHGRRGGVATERHKKPENYLTAVAEGAHGIKDQRALSVGEQASEALLMGLRLAEGVDLSEMEAQFGIATADLINADRLALHSDLRLLTCDGDRITVTPAGMPLLDALLGEIVADGLVTA